MTTKVMIISSVHRWDDTRIFHRQAKSLAKHFEVELHSPSDFISRESNGLKIFGLPRWNKEIDRLKILWILFKRVIKSEAKVIHFHDPELILIGIIVKIFTKKKVIYDVHEHIIYDIEDKKWIPNSLKFLIIIAVMLLEKVCVPRFDAVVYTTPSVGERYMQLSKNAVSIENYSKLSIFEDKENMTAKDPNTVIYLGRVTAIRGLEQVIRAIKYVILEIPNVRLLIVGDIVPHSYEKFLKELSKRLKLDNHVEFRGFIPHLETIQYLNIALCGIVTFLPTKEHKACLPNKLFEYMASGLAVIASNFELYQSIVNESGCGVTVDPENIEMIAENMINLLKNTEVTFKMGMNGISSFKEKYNWEQEEVKLINLYNKLLS